MTRVLVTGGSGFLGSTLVPVLAAHLDVDLVVSGDVRGPAKPPGPGVVVEELDVTDAARVREVVARHAVDAVVHLASIVTPPKGMSDEQARAVDVDGTRNVLEACVAEGVRRLVVSSSGAAYGYHADHPDWITEDQPVRGNDAFAYSRHKRQVEELLARARAEHPDVNQVVLRIGTILGERVDNQITALFEARRLLRIAGSDAPFVFVWDTDLAQVLARAATDPDVEGVFNVAGEGALGVEEIASRLGRRTVVVPELALKAVLALAHPLGLVPYGPEQTMFLRHRPVLDATRLRATFGADAVRPSSQAFDDWVRARERRAGRAD